MTTPRGDEIEAADAGLSCTCGSENFERVVVQRKPAAPIVTDFVACVGCSAMYWLPLRPHADPEFDYDKAFGPAKRRGQNSA